MMNRKTLLPPRKAAACKPTKPRAKCILGDKKVRKNEIICKKKRQKKQETQQKPMSRNLKPSKNIPK